MSYELHNVHTFYDQNNMTQCNAVFVTKIGRLTNYTTFSQKFIFLLNDNIYFLFLFRCRIFFVVF